MNEYSRLLQQYGLTGPTRAQYGGAELPTDITDPEYASKLESYYGDRNPYDQYQSGFDQRLQQFDLYGPGWQGEALNAPVYGKRSSKPLPKALVPAVASITGAQASGVTPGASSFDRSGGNEVGLNPHVAAFLDAETPAERDARMGKISDFFSNISTVLSPIGTLAQVALSKAATSDTPIGYSIGKVANMMSTPKTAAEIANTPVVDMFTTFYDPAGDTKPTGYGPDGMGPPSSAAGGDRSVDGNNGADRSADADRDHGNSGSAPGGGAATGGLITRSRFASGGLNELNQKYAPPGMNDLADIPGNRGLDMSRVTPEQLLLMQQQDPMALERGTARFEDSVDDITAPQPAAAAPVDSNTALMAMLEKYVPAQSSYGVEYAAARKQAAADQAKFEELLKQSMNESSATGPSKAEMYFQLAAAFGAPTKTGSFMESMGGASKVLAEHNKAEREAEAANRAEKRKLGLTIAQNRATQSKQDLSDLRALTSEELKGNRAAAIEMLKEHFKSGQPQSEAGKAAVDAGLTRGTPEFSKFVNEYISKKLENGDYFKMLQIQLGQTNAEIAASRLRLAEDEARRQTESAKKLTPGEMKLKTETEDLIAQSDQAMRDLREAYALNPKTFDTSLGDKAQRVILENLSSDDPRVVATRQQENLLSKSAVGKLRAAFGGNPTEGERKILLDLEGIGAKSQKERAEIMKNAFKALKAARDRQARRLADITAGRYRETAESIPKPPAEEIE